MRRRRWLALGAALAWGCTADLAVQTVARPDWQHYAAQREDCAFTVYWETHRFPASCREVGDVFVGDDGLSMECRWHDAMEAIRAEACRYGADAAQIVRHQRSGRWWPCHAVRARLMACEGGDDDAG